MFKKLFNPQNDGNLVTGGHLLFISLFQGIDCKALWGKFLERIRLSLQ